jgi:alpha-glucosidase
MRQERRLLTLLLLSVLLGSPSGAYGSTPAPLKTKEFKASSPDGRTVLKVAVGESLSYQIESGGQKIIEPSKIAMTLSDGTVIPGANPSVKSENLKPVNNTISTTVYKKSVVTDLYNPLVLTFREGYSVEFRVYDDGIAYRFHTKLPGAITVKEETAEFNFGGDHSAWFQYLNRWGKGDKYYTTFENAYVNKPLSKTAVPDSLIVAPAVVDLGSRKVAITEADLEDYPGMFLKRGRSEFSLEGSFAPLPRTTSISGPEPVEEGNLEAVVMGDRYDYIAVTSGTRSFPWRVIVIVENDIQLADNDMVYRLASPSRIVDGSWIKPGKVSWDWWIENDLWGVDFRAGVNYKTYREYIRFASENKLEYIIIDVGFSKSDDIMKVNPALRIEELIRYADSMNVGIIAWAGWLAIIDQMEEACAKYSAMGIKGFKIDYMNRDDQEVIKFYYALAETAARHKLLLDFHGASKPTGMSRTWPNVLTSEGVKGQEWCRWTNPDQPKHAVTFPFIRMLAGPVDFTPGVFRSESKDRFKISWVGSMGQGTRSHQMAMYVVFESPLQMLSDSPSRYREQQECTDFIAPVPTVWDETRALDGKIGEYIIMARRTGTTWYIGALTSWTQRKVEIDFSFLPEGKYNLEFFRDGANSNRYAQDYRRETRTVSAGEKLTVQLASGGGWAARLDPVKE